MEALASIFLFLLGLFFGGCALFGLAFVSDPYFGGPALLVYIVPGFLLSILFFRLSSKVKLTARQEREEIERKLHKEPERDQNENSAPHSETENKDGKGNR